eukprot:6181160-Pleurochrysis_carterae.AAC.7
MASPADGPMRPNRVAAEAGLELGWVGWVEAGLWGPLQAGWMRCVASCRLKEERPLRVWVELEAAGSLKPSACWARAWSWAIARLRRQMAESGAVRGHATAMALLTA